MLVGRIFRGERDFRWPSPGVSSCKMLPASTTRDGFRLHRLVYYQRGGWRVAEMLELCASMRREDDLARRAASGAAECAPLRPAGKIDREEGEEWDFRASGQRSARYQASRHKSTALNPRAPNSEPDRERARERGSEVPFDRRRDCEGKSFLSREKQWSPSFRGSIRRIRLTLSRGSGALRRGHFFGQRLHISGPARLRALRTRRRASRRLEMDQGDKHDGLARLFIGAIIPELVAPLARNNEIAEVECDPRISAT